MIIILGLLRRLMQKNEMLEYLEITEKYLLMFSTFTIKNLLLRKIKNVNYKGYVHDELKKKKKIVETLTVLKQFLILLISKDRKSHKKLLLMNLNPRNKTGSGI